ncbi:397_t:CDS:10, partial [Entrophospora sp. SA101]
MGNCASLSSDKQLKETGISSQSYHTDNNDKLSNVNVICHTGHIGIVELRSGKVDPEKIKKEMAEIAATLNIDEPEITDRSVEEFKIKENNDNGGEFLSLKEESYIDSYNPSTGKVHAKIPDSSKQEIDQAVHAAQKAFLKWSKTSVQIRSKIMYKIADLLEARLNEFAEAEVQDQGKTITFATNVDINRSIYNFRYFAGYILHTQEKAHVLDGVSLSYVQRYPIGVAGLISPESGLPDGVVNIVFGSGSNAGQALVSHPKVPLISFTGGTVTGKKVLETSAPFFKKLSLELGGKNPNIIFDDCDFDNAVDTSIKAAFSNQGEKLIVGDPKDSRTQVGALVSKQHMEKVLGYIELAKQEGGVIECGGKRKLMDDGELCGGYFVEPTVITNVKPSCRVAQEEIFGPVVTIHTFESEEEVIEYANDTEYGLSCSVWSGNGKRARRVAEAIQAGTVWVNCWLIRDLGLPFGGVKKSGNTTFALPKFSITSDNNNKRDEIQPLPLGVGTGAQLYDGELPLSCGGPKFIESGGEAYDNNYEYCSQESHSVQCCDDCSEQLSWSNQGENSYMVACRRDPLYMSYCDQSMDDYQGAGCHNNQYAESCDEQNNVLYGDGYQNSLSPELRQQQVSRTSLDEEALAEYVYSKIIYQAVVLFTGGAKHKPGWTWMFKAYKSLSRKKIKYINSLSQLAIYVPITQIDIPPAVYEHNLKFEDKITLPPSPNYDEDETSVFNVPIETLMGLEGEKGLPSVVKECVTYLRSEGVFRRSPSSLLLKQAMAAYNRGNPVNLEDYGVHVAAVLLKMFFSHLPIAVFPAETYDALKFIQSKPDYVKRIEYIRSSVFPLLSPAVIVLLRYVCSLLHEISKRHDKNLMTPYNLAVVFAPNLVHSGNPKIDIQHCLLNPNDPNVGGGVGLLMRLAIEYFDLMFEGYDEQKDIIREIFTENGPPPKYPSLRLRKVRSLACWIWRGGQWDTSTRNGQQESTKYTFNGMSIPIKNDFNKVSSSKNKSLDHSDSRTETDSSESNSYNCPQKKKSKADHYTTAS